VEIRRGLHVDQAPSVREKAHPLTGDEDLQGRQRAGTLSLEDYLENGTPPLST
jgi:hypothetical protein